MSIASTGEQRALQESIRAWTDKLDTSGVRDREPGTARRPPDPRWPELARLGVFSAALSEQAGGAGGGMADLAAALEQVAAGMLPGPVLPTALAGVLLDRYAAADGGAGALIPRLLADLAEGAASVAVAFGAGQLVASPGAENLVVSGSVDPVLGAGETSHLLLAARDGERDVWFVLDPERSGVRVDERPALDFSRSLGRVVLHEVVVPPDSVVSELDTERVRELAVTLSAAEMSGIANWCVRTAAEHAKAREQFGSPIGAFQAVKHLCAEMLCRTEQLGVLAWDAARACDESPAEHPLAASAAGAVAFDAAVRTAQDCVQVLGGTGFTWEHDAHLYLRRAMASRQLFGPSARWRERTAELALAGARRNLGVPPELLEQAEEQRGWVRRAAEEIAALPESEQRVRCAERGLLAPQWPEPYGLAADPALRMVVEEELERAGVSRPDLGIAAWAVPTVLSHGTPEQCERFAWPALRGETTWCQLFSEPGAGSDLASLRTRADRVAGGWRLSGQKVWTSLAHRADWAICLARTDPDAPKHRGITYFLVEMTSPGIDIRPLREITGESLFNEVFLEEVFVPDEAVVGAPGEGWRLARGTLADERVALSGSALGESLERVLSLVGAGRAGDEQCLRELGDHVAQGLSMSLLGLRATLRRLRGESPGAESSVQKLVGVRHRQAVAEFAVEVLGPDAAAVDGEAATVSHEYLVSRCLSIAGGTTQILLTLVADRLLGLPRA